jgi:hypothetical protein
VRRILGRESISLAASVAIGMVIAMVLDGAPLVVSIGLLIVVVLARLLVKGRANRK